LYGLWTGLITLVIILYNFAGVWAMARVLLPRLLGRRGKALVAAVDGWLKPKKA
ncbi:lipopolysaccharide biosynthesis protein, partial [Klebsiella pneumoniae subsp. pneumoniae]|nr:lipopolysaccharide biosynthesis protein [Klebsiella pneumoniae subsp. pneumoniae]